MHPVNLKIYPANRFTEEDNKECSTSKWQQSISQGGTNSHRSSKLTPVSGCAVQANSVVAHFVSINVSVNRSRRRATMLEKEEHEDRRYP